MKKSLLAASILSISINSFSQNVGINSTGATPRNCAMLDIISTNKGLLIPTVALTNVITYSPLTGVAVDGLLVYSSAAPTNGNGTGYYYWNTISARWVNLIGSISTGNPWYLNGNIGNTAVAAPATYGTSTIPATGHFLGTTDANDIVFGTNQIERMRIKQTNGFVGIGTAAPTTQLHVIADANNSPVIYGINQNSTAGTASFGVRGECGATGLGSAGISGVSTNSGQNEIGTLGDYSLWGSAVFGLAWAGAYTDMPSSRDFGVFGTVNFSTGTGVYGRNTNTSASAYGMYCMGNFAVTNTKSASVPTTKGNQLVYSQESPEIWFEDIGSAKLVNGKAEVKLDAMYLETVFIDAQHPIQVFLQEKGECNGLYVINENDKFFVKEKNGGTSNIEFSYRILAKRRFYQDHRFGVDANQPLEDNLSKAKYHQPITTDLGVMKQFVESETAKKETEYAKMKAEEKTKK